MAFLRKRKKKDGYFYYVYFWYNGKKHGKCTRTGDKKVAQAILKEIEVRLAKKTFKLDDFEPQISVYLKDFAAEYLEYSKSRKAIKTFKRDELCFKSFCKFAGNRSLKSINHRLIDQYLSQRVEQVKPSTVNIEIRHLKAAFTKAVQWDYIEKNPFKGVKQFDTIKNKALFLSEEEIELLLDAIEEQWLHDIVFFAINTGVRIGELVNIQWEHINWKKNEVIIKNTRTFVTKTKRERMVPLNPDVIDLLRSLPRTSEYVFPNSAGNLRDKVAISRRFKKYIRQLNFNEEYTFHTTRHTFASHLIQKGYSLFMISAILGHSQAKTTELYAHLVPSNLHDVVKSLHFGKGKEKSSNLGIVRGDKEAGKVTGDNKKAVASNG